MTNTVTGACSGLSEIIARGSLHNVLTLQRRCRAFRPFRKDLILEYLRRRGCSRAYSVGFVLVFAEKQDDLCHVFSASLQFSWLALKSKVRTRHRTRSRPCRQSRGFEPLGSPILKLARMARRYQGQHLRAGRAGLSAAVAGSRYRELPAAREATDADAASDLHARASGLFALP
jgi:hypothetical protein